MSSRFLNSKEKNIFQKKLLFYHVAKELQSEIIQLSNKLTELLINAHCPYKQNKHDMQNQWCSS